MVSFCQSPVTLQRDIHKFSCYSRPRLDEHDTGSSPTSRDLRNSGTSSKWTSSRHWVLSASFMALSLSCCCSLSLYALPPNENVWLGWLFTSSCRVSIVNPFGKRAQVANGACLFKFFVLRFGFEENDENRRRS